jgi:Uma2 family endonuclease
MSAALLQEFPCQTRDEYYQYEARASEKHEFYQGMIYAMAGASRVHGILVGALTTVVNNRLEGTSCFAVPADQKVRAETDDLDAYPDVVVYCDDAAFDPQHPHTLLEPLILIEVLSPSTGRYDRNAKRAAYLKIPSLRDYLVVSQDTVFIEHDFRAEGGIWERREYGRRADLVQLDSVEIEVPVAEIYRRLDLPESSD